MKTTGKVKSPSEGKRQVIAKKDDHENGNMPRSFIQGANPVQAILHLQRTIGNQAVQRLVEANAVERDKSSFAIASPKLVHDFGRIPLHAGASSIIQPKLMISTPGDKYEQEADRVAEQVMRIQDPILQRQPLSEEEEEELVQAKPIISQITPLIQSQVEEEENEQEEDLVQTKKTSGKASTVTPSLSSQINAIRGKGQPLSQNTRAFFEPRFGYDFSQVCVHYDAQAADAARKLKAQAFTTGKDIFFGSGRYQPYSSPGRQLLAHELTHVVQQKFSQGQRKFATSQPEDKREQDADQIAQALKCLDFSEHDDGNIEPKLCSQRTSANQGVRELMPAYRFRKRRTSGLISWFSPEPKSLIQEPIDIRRALPESGRALAVRHFSEPSILLMKNDPKSTSETYDHWLYWTTAGHYFVNWSTELEKAGYTFDTYVDWEPVEFVERGTPVNQVAWLITPPGGEPIIATARNIISTLRPHWKKLEASRLGEPRDRPLGVKETLVGKYMIITDDERKIRQEEQKWAGRDVDIPVPCAGTLSAPADMIKVKSGEKVGRLFVIGQDAGGILVKHLVEGKWAVLWYSSRYFLQYIHRQILGSLAFSRWLRERCKAQRKGE